MPLHVTGAGPGEPRFLTPEECDGLNGRLVVNGPGSAIEIGPDSVANSNSKSAPIACCDSGVAAISVICSSMPLGTLK